MGNSGAFSKAIAINHSDNKFVISVTGADGKQKMTYKVTVTRANPFLQSLVVSEGALEPAFDHKVYDYDVEGYGHSTTVTAVPKDARSEIQINGAVVKAGTKFT